MEEKVMALVLFDYYVLKRQAWKMLKRIPIAKLIAVVGYDKLVSNAFVAVLKRKWMV
jgi:hypothetical protein